MNVLFGPYLQSPCISFTSSQPVASIHLINPVRPLTINFTAIWFWLINFINDLQKHENLLACRSALPHAIVYLVRAIFLQYVFHNAHISEYYQIYEQM